MSQTALPPAGLGKKKKSKSSMLWIALSFVLSACIVGWAFTLPFRNSGMAIATSASATTSETYEDLAKQARAHRNRANESREAALAMDEEFMTMLAERKAERTRVVPGIEHSKSSWDRHVANVKREAFHLKSAKKGSLEWRYRQSLQNAVKDGPR